MNIDEYRQRFRDYTAARALAELRRARARSRGPEPAEILCENSDLFRREAVEELRGVIEETSIGRETERAAIGKLAAFAERGYLELATRELWAEIQQWTGEKRIAWEEERFSLAAVEERLANEGAPGKRRELWARVADLLRRIDDLFTEFEARCQEAARALGYPHHLAALEASSRIDAAQLAERANLLLKRTDRRYDLHWPQVFSTEAGVGREEASEADLPRVERMARFDRWLVNARLATVYREMFTGFGFRTDSQANVSVDLDAGRQDGCLDGWRSGCFAIRVPEDIRLQMQPAGDPTDYRRLLMTAARVQHFAWTSAELRPELQVPGDGGLGEGWAALFDTLRGEPGWLIETFGFVEHEEYRKTAALVDLLRVRRDAARLRFEVELYGDRLAGGPGLRYTELLGEALGVRVEESSRWPASWFEASTPLISADRLRGRAFAWQLREHLKTRYGHNWWRARKAGEMIIDVWNTGHRYTVEDLARLLGLGDLDFDGLADEMLRAC